MKNFPPNIVTCPLCRSLLVFSDQTGSCPACQKKYHQKNGVLILGDFENKAENQIQIPKTSPFLYSVAHRLSYYYILKYLSLRAGDNLLDIGCGLGHFLKLAEAKTDKIIGIDNDFDSLNFASHTTLANLVLAKAKTLPFADSTFDKITIVHVLEHIENDAKAVKEIKRVAKNNATVVIEVPAMEGRRTNAKLHTLMHDSGTEKHFRTGYSLSQLKNLLDQEGLIIEKTQFTFVYFTELFIELTKYMYWRKNKKYDSQIDILKVTENSSLFKIYKIFFPLILLLAKLEDKILSAWLKGHAIVLKVRVKK